MLIYPTCALFLRYFVSINVYSIIYFHDVGNPSKYINLPNLEKLILVMTEKNILPNGF